MNDKFPFRFFIITFSWSWLIWFFVILMGNGTIPVEQDLFPALAMVLSIIAVLGPPLGGLISTYTLEGKEGLKAFVKSFFSLKFGLKTWLLIFGVFGISTLISWILPEFWGEERVGMFLPNAYIFPLYWLAMVFFGGGQEEIGWRAYILPHLERHLGVAKASLVLGIVWAVWHIPLWFIPGMSQQNMPFAGFVMLTVGYSFFLSWIYKASGKRPMSALVAHGTANAFVPLFPVVIAQSGDSLSRYWIWVSLTLIIGVYFLWRMKREAV